jgi:acyl-ACP thioesterase
MDRTGIFHFTADSELLDFRGRISIPAIGSRLLHVASVHAAERGFGYSDMQGRNVAWVLSRLAIEVKRYPGLSEDITLYTWIEGAAGLFTHRCFELVSGQGETFCYARSIWAAIHLETRRPVPLDAETLNAFRVERPCPIEKPGKIPPAEHLAPGETFRVRYSDLDINGHLNSIRSMERLLDTFSPDLFMQKQIARFEITYMAEGRYGMELSVHSTESLPGTYHLAMCCEGKAICRASAAWHEITDQSSFLKQ